VKQLSGDRFDKGAFDQLKNDEGFISREQFLAAVAVTNVEKEAFSSFLRFCPSGEMDSKTFAKICKDAKLIDTKTFTGGDADLVFAKAKARRASGKSINYDAFRQVAINGIAEKKGVDETAILTILAQCQGPVMNATQTENVRLHDDTTTYTGAHAQGGPTFEQGGGGLATHLDRTEADVTGVKISDRRPSNNVIQRKGSNTTDASAAAGAGAGRRTSGGIEAAEAPRRNSTGAAVAGATAAAAVAEAPRKGSATLAASAAGDIQRKNSASGEVQRRASAGGGAGSRKNSNSTGALPDVPDSEMLRAVFQTYCPTSEMDSRTLVKLLKDTNIINKKFDTNAADLVFNKAKAKSGLSKISYDLFRTVALPDAILRSTYSIEHAMELIGGTSGPSYNATKAEAVRFHDDAGTYTGAHAHGGPTFDHGSDVLSSLVDRSDADVRGVKLG
jgi:hypothetical protein